MAPKTYFILKGTEWKANEFIELGQVVEDPEYPHQRLAAPLPLPKKPEEGPELRGKQKFYVLTSNLHGWNATQT